MECYGRYKILDVTEIVNWDLPITITPLGSSTRRTQGRTFVAMVGLTATKLCRSNIISKRGREFAYHYTVNNNSLENMVEGLVNRIFLVQGKAGLEKPPPVELGVFDSIGYLVYQIRRELGELRLMSPEEWVESAPAHRRAVYREALNNLNQSGWLDKFYEVKLFVKGSREAAAEDKACRMICPSYEECLVKKGPFIKSIEDPLDGKSLYRVIDSLWDMYCGVEFPVCTKGLTQDAIGELVYNKWGRFNDPVYTCFDCSRYSQHTRGEALEYAYSLVYACFEDARNWVKAQGVRGKAIVADCNGISHAVKVDLPAMLFDGSNETAFVAHVVINNIFIDYFKGKGIKIEPLDCGDDFGCISERGAIDTADVIAHLLRFGYTLKIDGYADEVGKIVFCQCSPIILGSRKTMIRGLSCLEKDALLMCQESEVSDRLLAVGLGGAHTNYGVPVYHNFYRMLVRLSGQSELKKKHVSHLYSSNYLYYQVVTRDTRRMDAVAAVEYTQEDRYNFWLTTGMTPREQVDRERRYDSATFGEPTLW